MGNVKLFLGDERGEFAVYITRSMQVKVFLTKFCNSQFYFWRQNFLSTQSNHFSCRRQRCSSTETK